MATPIAGTGIRDSLSLNKADRMRKRAVKDQTKGKDAGVVNPRVWNMYGEAISFKQDLSTFEQELRRLETATLEFAEGMLPLLRAPLPRVWNRVGEEGQLAEPLRASVTHYGHPDISGGNMDDAGVRTSVAEYEKNMQLRVRRPLTQWVSALEGVRGRVPELDRLRTRLEQRTRKVKAEEQRKDKEERKRQGVRRGGGDQSFAGQSVKKCMFKCTHPMADASEAIEGKDREAFEGPPAEASREDFKREDQDVKYKEELRKLLAATEAFSADEGLLYEQLSGLCRDATWLKSYMASALVFSKELFQAMGIELGDCLQPLPACKVPSVDAAARGLRSLSPAGDSEEVDTQRLLTPVKPRTLGSNLGYVASMPEFAQRMRARKTLEELKEAARKRMHAHMATSSPLELHALPSARAGDLPRSAAGSRALSTVDQQDIYEQQQMMGKGGPMAAASSAASTSTTPGSALSTGTGKPGLSPSTPGAREPEIRQPQGLAYT